MIKKKDKENKSIPPPVTGLLGATRSLEQR